MAFIGTGPIVEKEQNICSLELDNYSTRQLDTSLHVNNTWASIAQNA